MSRHRYKAMIAVLSTMFVVVSCGIPGKAPTRVPDTPIVVGPAEAFLNNLAIRIDSVQILKDDGDHGSGGEVYFAILVRRESGESAKLLLPGNGILAASVGDALELSAFSLAVNEVQERERIDVYLLGFESDQDTWDDRLANRALDGVVLVIEELVPGDSLLKFGYKVLAGDELRWWEAEDSLGECWFVLDERNNWLQGQQYYAQSANENLDIAFTVTKILEVPSTVTSKETVVLTVVNSTSSTVEKIYISPEMSSGWHLNWLEKGIPPGESRFFSVPTGVYDLRAEGSEGMPWEINALDLTRDRIWTIGEGK